MSTLYIAPAMTDQAGQCRIYACAGYHPMKVREHFAKYPGQWKEVGLMNSRGQLVCFEGTEQQRQDLTDDQPLMAGLAYTYPEELS